MAIFKKINFGLSKTRNKMSGAIDDMLDSFDEFSDDLYTELEEILVMGDVGVITAVAVVEELKSRVRSERIKRPDEVKKELQNIIAELLYGGEDMGLITIPSIILVIGVNGVGKTTTIGKMAAMYKSQGKKVILAAADTFRAAAIDQLDIWAQRAGVEIVKHKEGADPAAVIFDTIAAGKARESDIIICDTAGRLHNKKNLMEELAKIYKVIDRELPYSDREVLLVLDATTGQNAVNQAKEFLNVAELTGIVLTKLDGTARGGVVLSIKNELKIPVKFIGVGEAIDDLQPFDPAAFAKSLFEEVSENYEEDSYYYGDLEEKLAAEAQKAAEDAAEIHEEVCSDGSQSGDNRAESDDVRAETPGEGTQTVDAAQEETGKEENETQPEARKGSADTEVAVEAELQSGAGQTDEREVLIHEEATQEPDIQEIVAETQTPTDSTASDEESSSDLTDDEFEAAERAEEEALRQAKEETKQDEGGKKKERRGFFGFFNRHS